MKETLTIHGSDELQILSLENLKLKFYRKDVLSKKQFYLKKEAVRESLFPSRKPHLFFSAHCHSDEPLLQELSARERPNRVGMMTVGGSART